MSNQENPIYTSTLCRTVSKATGQARYYLSVCGVMRRISKAEFNLRYSAAFRKDSMLTKETKTTFKHYVCVYFNHYN